ncbi:MAG: hypothetical protein K2K54_04115 [Lachnospiraceae bacterium]|nr:hypothetical protein [Lachnospiraceae bacterium]
MKKKIMTVLLAMCMMIMATACGGGASFEAGSFDGTTYTNTSVGIKATIPEGFSEISATTVTGITYEVVVQSDAGSAIQIIAEDMKQTIGRAVNAKTYLDSMKDQVDTQYGAMGLSTDVTDLGTVKVGGKDFNGISIAITGSGAELTQDYYICKVGDVMFCIIVTDADNSLGQFISSIEAAE